MPIDPTAARFGRCDEAQYTAPTLAPDDATRPRAWVASDPASADFDRLRTDLSALVAAVTSLWIPSDAESGAACDDVDEAVRWLALAAGLGVLDADGPVLTRLDPARTVATARAMLRELTPALAARVADPWRGAVLHAGLAVAERALDALGCQAARRAEAGREHGPTVQPDRGRGEWAR